MIKDEGVLITVHNHSIDRIRWFCSIWSFPDSISRFIFFVFPALPPHFENSSSFYPLNHSNFLSEMTSASFIIILLGLILSHYLLSLSSFFPIPSSWIQSRDLVLFHHHRHDALLCWNILFTCFVYSPNLRHELVIWIWREKERVREVECEGFRKERGWSRETDETMSESSRNGFFYPKTFLNRFLSMGGCKEGIESKLF